MLDNTLLGDRVVDPQDERSRTMAALNERIAADERVDSVLLGFADGVTLRAQAIATVRRVSGTNNATIRMQPTFRRTPAP